MRGLNKKMGPSIDQPTVLILSTYPYVNPKHGGQIRLYEISKTYRNLGFYVHPVAVYKRHTYSGEDAGQNDIRFSPIANENSATTTYSHILSDFTSGHIAGSDSTVYRSITESLPASIDFIHLEQPWLMPLVRRLIAECKRCNNALLIYGSQNIESKLKHEIYKSLDIKVDDQILRTLSEIEILEQEAAQAADLVLTVSEADKVALDKLGAKHIVHTPNGISHLTPSDKTLKYWQEKLPKEPWLLYVASAHPPNYTDFLTCFGGSLGCIPPNSRLVIAGGVCEHIYSQLSASKWHNLNLSRIQLLYQIESLDLAAVKALTHGFVLPITTGGGSNLKTAEAIYSGLPIICTSASLRGYEKFKDSPLITVTDTPEDMRLAVCNFFRKPSRQHQQLRPTATELLWESCLRKFSESLVSLYSQKASSSI